MELGISSIWIGLESPQSRYAKLDGADTLRLAAELREHGIVLLGSTIVGLEHHTPENIEAEIEHAVAHETDLHQFMLYTPVPGTPLYQEMQEQGRLLDVDLADIHGQDAFNFRHAAHFARGVAEVAGLGLPARLRTQRPEPVPHLPHQLRRLDAIQEPSRSARARAVPSRGASAAARLPGEPVGDGAPPAPHESRSGRDGCARCARNWSASSE